MYSTSLSGRGYASTPYYSTILSGRGESLQGGFLPFLAPILGMIAKPIIGAIGDAISKRRQQGSGVMYSTILSGRGHRLHHTRGSGQHSMPGKALIEAGKRAAIAKNLQVEETFPETLLDPLTTIVMEEHDGVVVKRPRGRPARSKGVLPSGTKVVSSKEAKAGQKHTEKGLQALAAAQRGSGLYF